VASHVIVAFFTVFSSAVSLNGDDPVEAWRVDFKDPESIGGVHYVVREGKPTPDGLVMSIDDGVLTFGAEFDQDSGLWDHAVLGWGEGMPSGFWQWRQSAFVNVDVKDYPILEIRARRAPGLTPNFSLAPVFETQTGVIFTQIQIQVSDDWGVYKFRFSPLSSAPRPTTPRTLRGLIVRVGGGRQPCGLQLDWIRVRAFTSAERARDDVIVRTLASYAPPNWRQPFFVYGPYGSSTRATSRMGGFEGAYGAMVRAHCNYQMAPHTISYYRFQHRKDQSQDQNISDFLEINQKAVASADATGLSISLDVRGFEADLLEHGPDFVDGGVARVAETFRDQPVVLGYTVADEPVPSDLWRVAGVKQLFEKHDPTKLVAFAIADSIWAPDFDPFTTVHVLDKYPINADERNLDKVSNQMDRTNEITDQPVWFIVQAFGDKPWYTDKPPHRLMPTEAEYRRMVYMAIARGANGVMFYDWFHKPWQTVVDRYGNPGPLYDVVNETGLRLAAVGSILLRCEATEAASTHGPFEIHELKLPDPETTILVACNTDIDKSHELTLDAGEELEGELLTSVAPGDARFFALAQVVQLKAEIAANLHREESRVAKPDQSITARWGDAADEMKLIGDILDNCAPELGDQEKAVTAAVNRAKPGMEDAFFRHHRIGEQYDLLRARWIAGDREGLAESVDELRRKVEALSADIGLR
jgi:hypothetical protein